MMFKKTVLTPEEIHGKKAHYMGRSKSQTGGRGSDAGISTRRVRVCHSAYMFTSDTRPRVSVRAPASEGQHARLLVNTRVFMCMCMCLCVCVCVCVYAQADSVVDTQTGLLNKLTTFGRKDVSHTHTHTQHTHTHTHTLSHHTSLHYVARRAHATNVTCMCQCQHGT